MVQTCNSIEYFSKITAIIDKIDKIGQNKVIEELKNDIPNQNCWKLFNELFSLDNSTQIILNWLKTKLESNQEGLKWLTRA